MSILIGNYNKDRWLTEAIWSALSQIYQRIEIIICDDGSTDHSREIISVFDGSPNFKSILRSKCSGCPAVSYNAALAEAKGEYISILGSDDRMLPNHIRSLVKLAIKNPNADYIFGDLQEIDASGQVFVSLSKGKSELIYSLCQIGIGSVLFKKTVFDELGNFDEKVGCSEDWEYTIRVFKARKKVLYSGLCGAQWRKYGSNRSLTVNQGEVRKKAHSYIRTKHKLGGICGCGCGGKDLSWENE